ncbi:DNA repair protein rad16 [Apophysomyces sp. BC1034]|nr:DNA repair protein rad16 [Apophysomyces sp. BC1034]
MVATRRSTRLAEGSSSASNEPSNSKNSRDDSQRASVCSESDDDFQPLPNLLSRRRTRSSMNNEPIVNNKRRKGSSMTDNEESGGAASQSTRLSTDRKGKGKGKAILPQSPDTMSFTSGFDSIVDTPETTVSDYSKDEESDALDVGGDAENETGPVAELESEVDSDGHATEESDYDSSAEEEEEAGTNATGPARPTRGRRSYYQQTSDLLLAQHKELRNVWEELKSAEHSEITPAEQPEKLSLPLLSFQKHGVGWMLQQEKLQEDEMGMGKTIQTISLLLSDDQGPSLVIAPTVAIVQWKREIETHTNNALKICLFHGARRPTNVNELLKHDVILSTYRSCNTARAVFNMNGNYRWSLTGTPLQNRVGELYSLIRFMQAGCDTCGHKPMDHVCWWNNEVLKPIQSRGNVGEGREAMGKLRLLLDKIMLRRTKIECADDLGLPPRTVVVRRDLFNEEEEDFYTSLFSDSVRKFTTYVEEANHPDLVTKKKNASDNKQLVCMLCSETPEDAIAAACKHVFCRECCVQYYQSFDNEDGVTERPKCPTCFADFSVDLSQPSLELNFSSGGHSSFSKSSIINRIDMEKWRSSSKIEALVEELMKLQSEDKTIKRHDYLASFMTKPSVTVFLISLKAGGVALNLTEASRVFICDPWWNPKRQAMDRIHRLGQHRPIKITRLIIENSIESRIVQLQEKKQALVESTIGKDKEALEKLTVEDLQFLFAM